LEVSQDQQAEDRLVAVRNLREQPDNETGPVSCNTNFYNKCGGLSTLITGDIIRI
jgi:hypothetical protein